MSKCSKTRQIINQQSNLFMLNNNNKYSNHRQLQEIFQNIDEHPHTYNKPINGQYNSNNSNLQKYIHPQQTASKPYNNNNNKDYIYETQIKNNNKNVLTYNNVWEKQQNESQIYTQVRQIKAALKFKDNKIGKLEKQVEQLKCALENISNRQNRNLTVDHRNNKLYQHSETQRYKKQLKFVTQNNQQLYEQTKNNKIEIKKLKSKLLQAIQYSKQLRQQIEQISQQNQKLKQINSKLLKQKENIIRNSEEQIRLFKQMQHVWKTLHNNDIEFTQFKTQLSTSLGYRGGLSRYSSSGTKRKKSLQQQQDQNNKI